MNRAGFEPACGILGNIGALWATRGVEGYKPGGQVYALSICLSSYLRFHPLHNACTVKLSVAFALLIASHLFRHLFVCPGFILSAPLLGTGAAVPITYESVPVGGAAVRL